MNLSLLISRVRRLKGQDTSLRRMLLHGLNLLRTFPCARTPVRGTVCDTRSANKTCPSDGWHRSRAKNSPLETIHVCVRSAEKALIRPITGLPLSERMGCALHPNVLIYSSLKLNTAVNAPSDSITLCPRSSTGEACVPLIKFQNAIEMAKIRL